ncbi:MAG: hydroxyisourate hydrolase [Candidatus Acidiferrum sp.]
MADGVSRISTHVLDTALGVPAVGVPVCLEQQSGSEWHALGSSQTDGDGRCKQLLPEYHVLAAGRYRLVFNTDAYFANQNVLGLYPVVEITFDVRSGESHFHIPLLLSPNGYTTYRGS